MKRADAKVIAFIAPFVSLISQPRFLGLQPRRETEGESSERLKRPRRERILPREDKSVSERKIKLSDQ